MKNDRSNNMKLFFLIGLGGFIGTTIRYAVQLTLTNRIVEGFPVATFIINISGSLLIGVLYGLSLRYQWLNDNVRLFLAVGFCGGYTTFSTFSLDMLSLLQQGNYFTWCSYIFLSVFLGLFLTWVGFILVK